MTWRIPDIADEISMSTTDKQFANQAVAQLNEGKISFGKQHVPIASTKANVLNLMTSEIAGLAREWVADNSVWTRLAFMTEVLWYSPQPVAFTFRDHTLMLVEFYDPSEPDSGGDYSRETKKYFGMKRTLVQHLGRETRLNESNTLNMEAWWDFPKVSLVLTCDAKTGGCSLSLRSPSYRGY